MRLGLAAMLSLLMGCGPECPLCEGWYIMTGSLDSGCAEPDFFSLIVRVDRDGPDIVPEGECTGSSGLVDDGCGYDYAYQCASSEIDGGRVERTIQLSWVDETTMEGTATLIPYDEGGTMGCVDRYRVRFVQLSD